MNSTEILERLVAFPTVSRDSNLDLIGFAQEFLESIGGRCRLVHNETGTKSNLFAEIGPPDRPGFMLSGHSDVVPVDGQNWASDPFQLTARGSRLFGRGTADMKGFLACALYAASNASRRDLRTPLWIAISYDEEIGCIGVRRLIDVMASGGLRPVGCIVGEPTSMAVATGHKGKSALLATCTGKAAHTAYAPKAVNALHLACDFVGLLRALQHRLMAEGAQDTDYEIPFTTVHAARITGGIAANIVPEEAVVEFEIRNIAADDPSNLIDALNKGAEQIASEFRPQAKEASIAIRTANSYPGLSTDPGSRIVAFVKSLTGSNSTPKVAFGTEAGLFAERIGTPSVICGPGSMEQGHKADEFVSRQQLERCDRMLDRLIARLEEGIPSLS